MVTGIGVDIIGVARIKDGWEKYQDRFLDRLFTPEEVDYCLQRGNPEVHLAARFAAKEAVVKAFGTGLRGMKWTEIEVWNDQSGRPNIRLHNQAELLAKQLEIREILISLSHTKQQAIAYAAALAE